MFLLHGLKTPDIVFFVICGAIIVVIIAIYFLIPVFKAKQYAEARKSLERRELLFRDNLKQNQDTTTEVTNDEVNKAEVEELEEKSSTLEE